jgi:hypothetical protein
LFPKKVSKCGLEPSFDHILTAASPPRYLIATNDGCMANRRIEGMDAVANAHGLLRPQLEVSALGR